MNAKTYKVEPRYLEAYRGSPCIITKDKAQVNLLRREFRYTIKKEGNLYTVTLQAKSIYPIVRY